MVFFSILIDRIIVMYKLGRSHNTRFFSMAFGRDGTRSSNKVLEIFLEDRLKVEELDLRNLLTTVCGRVALRT